MAVTSPINSTTPLRFLISNNSPSSLSSTWNFSTSVHIPRQNSKPLNPIFTPSYSDALIAFSIDSRTRPASRLSKIRVCPPRMVPKIRMRPPMCLILYRISDLPDTLSTIGRTNIHWQDCHLFILCLWYIIVIHRMPIARSRPIPWAPRAYNTGKDISCIWDVYPSREVYAIYTGKDILGFMGIWRKKLKSLLSDNVMELPCKSRILVIWCIHFMN